MVVINHLLTGMILQVSEVYRCVFPINNKTLKREDVGIFSDGFSKFF